MNYADLRTQFTGKDFDVKDADANPFIQFDIWFNDMLELNEPDSNAVLLSTSTKEGRPSSRVVLLKAVDSTGFVFYTNYSGRKSKELEENPYASMLFFFKSLHRQVRIEGKIEKVSREESLEYFHSRPRDSQIAAWASQQSSKIESRKVLEENFERLSKEFEGKEIPLPDFWGGFRLVPEYFEFWQGQENRMHDRVAYEKAKAVNNNQWLRSRLSP